MEKHRNKEEFVFFKMKWLVKDKCKVINSYTLMQQRDCVLCQTADQFVLLSHLHEAFCRGYSSWGSLFWNRNCNLLIIGCADYRLQSKIQLQLFSQNSILTLFSKLSIIFFLNVALVHLHTSLLYYYTNLSEYWQINSLTCTTLPSCILRLPLYSISVF